MKFKDYYEILGVSRAATQDEIRTSFRRLARKYHPDVNKAKDAEEKFKEIGEAHEVLGDPEKRRKYDQLGTDWQNGENFTPPPGWETYAGRGQPASASDFSDFFEAIFGSHFGGMGGSEEILGGFGRRRARDAKGEDQTVRVRIPLEDSFTGTVRDLSFRVREMTSDGRTRLSTRTLEVQIPQGVTDGQRIRLAGQGGPGVGRGPSGDLYLTVELEPHPKFRVEGRDLYTVLPAAPWEAALGANILMHVLVGDVSLTVPPGTSSGQKLRLRGKGLPNPRGTPGDLYVEVRIMMPKTLTKRQREAWEILRESNFNPRTE